MPRAGLVAGALSIACLLIGLHSGSAQADAGIGGPLDSCRNPQDLRFPAGGSSASVSGVAMRDTQLCYVVGARKGQRLDLAMTGDSSSNAVLLAFRPGWGFRDVHGYQMMDGDALPGAGRDDGAHKLRAILPESGRYLIEVATARGDAASYTLRIRIR